MKTLKPVTLFFFSTIGLFFSSCNNQNKTENKSDAVAEQLSVSKSKAPRYILKTPPAQELDHNIRSIFQDRKGNYWFGTNGTGVYRYDGHILTQFTVSDGLCSNQVQSIQEDQSGDLWFGTGAFGVSRFNGQTFTTFTNQENLRLNNAFKPSWKIEPNDLWFAAGDGAYRYHAQSFDYLPFNNTDPQEKQSQGAAFTLSSYSVYSILKDKKGNVWFGTQAQGVCRFDGKTFTWFVEKGLSGSAVLALFEDHKGNLWFGNNGSGLFRYDGQSVTNVTEEKGLSNPEFKMSGKSGPGTLARIYAINEDHAGNLWIGTVDAGLWKYDGDNLTNYTTKNGLPGNAINTVYKDQDGVLWFGTDADGIFKLIGNNFIKFNIENR